LFVLLTVPKLSKPMTKFRSLCPKILNGIWEGSSNVICLDVLRAMQGEPESVGVLLGEIENVRAANARLDAFVDDLKRHLANLAGLEPIARRVVEMMACAMQASLLIRYSSSAVADAFCATRLDGDWGRAFGTLPAGVDARAIVDRAADRRRRHGVKS
jgi:putative acyl-CoA dehydrogenase